MSNVTLTIGGRDFTVAAADGEEDHIARLGRMIDDRLRELGSAASGQSENRMLLFAALVLADDLFELKRKAGAHGGAADETAGRIAGEVEALADRIEKLASDLEGRSQAS
ncbi:cell division protein ZapA [Novosphingobium sp. ZN18A2]|uniref:cell division protein ZapA n=1 Tax=Novosphingobium sp. ZN18A2 TaxID=3079861 RepID=UPI0030CBE741